MRYYIIQLLLFMLKITVVFNGDQFGGFFETLGLDSYNPVSIAKQQLNQGDKSELNYSVNMVINSMTSFLLT